MNEPNLIKARRTSNPPAFGSRASGPRSTGPLTSGTLQPGSWRRWFRLLGLIGLAILIVYLIPLALSYAAYRIDEKWGQPWWELRRTSSQQAPDPALTEQAVIQVYAARAARWRGAFGVHSWIVTKPTHSQAYQRLEVMGYQLRWSDQSVRISEGRPDSYWYGSKPHLLRELRGAADVDGLIARLHDAATRYPDTGTYSVWPGPNSNTFIAWLAREVPELQLELPVTAIGKDYLSDAIIAKPPSGQGLMISLGGLGGLIVSPEEGFELNLLGFSAGLDINPIAIKLPGLGRFGFRDFKRLDQASAPIAKENQTD